MNVLIAAGKLVSVECRPNLVIGKNGTLLFRHPEDLKRFKQLTTGHAILMGRKTFEEIGKPLPNRLNYVVTHNPDGLSAYASDNLIAVGPEEFNALLAKYKASEDTLFIAGGASIYSQAISADLVDEFDLTFGTHVHATLEPEYAYFDLSSVGSAGNFISLVSSISKGYATSKFKTVDRHVFEDSRLRHARIKRA